MAKKKSKHAGKNKNARRPLEQDLVQALQGLAARNARPGLFDRLANLGPGQQVLIGALLGAGAVYILGDEKIRGKLLRAGMSLYGNLLSGFEEIREQVADIQAEMEAGLTPDDA